MRSSGTWKEQRGVAVHSLCVVVVLGHFLRDFVQFGYTLAMPRVDAGDNYWCGYALVVRCSRWLIRWTSALSCSVVSISPVLNSGKGLLSLVGVAPVRAVTESAPPKVRKFRLFIIVVS